MSDPLDDRAVVVDLFERRGTRPFSSSQGDCPPKECVERRVAEIHGYMSQLPFAYFERDVCTELTYSIVVSVDHTRESYLRFFQKKRTTITVNWREYTDEGVYVFYIQENNIKVKASNGANPPTETRIKDMHEERLPLEIVAKVLFASYHRLRKKHDPSYMERDSLV